MKSSYKYILSVVLLLASALFANVANAYAEDEQYHVIYHDQNGSIIKRVPFTQNYQFDENMPPFFVELPYKNVAWNTKADGTGTSYTKNSEPLTTLTEDLNVYAELKEGHFVRFDSKGGTPIEYQFVLSGEKAVKPVNPTRTGYTFAQWYTDEACTAAYDFNTVVTADIKLYAKWIPETAKYTVRIWLEKAEHSGTTTASDYTYYGSFLKVGTTEGEVSFNNTAGSADMRNTVVQAAVMSHTSPDSFPIFFNDNNGNSNALTLTNNSKQLIAANGGIAGDGSTVFDVYFRRIYLNFTLDDGDILGGGHFKETHQMRNGESVKAWLQRYNISVKQSFMDIMSQSTLTLDYQYQQTIYNLSSVSLYSTAHDITCLATACSFVNLYGLLSDGYRTSLVDNIGWELKLKSAPKGKNQFDIQYFYETVESAIAGNETDFRQYKESDFNKGGELLYNRPDISEWDGFSFTAGAGFSKYFIQSRDDDGNYGKIKLKNGDIINGTPMEWNSGTGSFQSFTKFGQRLKFYYIRNRYDLSFATNIGSITIPSISIVYGDAIKNHKDAVKYTDETGEHYLIPDQTTYRDDKYVIWIFKGWYAKSDFSGVPIDITTTTMTMPGSTLTLYAKWEPKTIKAEYDGNGGKVEGKDKIEKEQSSGKIPVRPADPVAPEGMYFYCWTINGKYYDFQDPISDDTKLVAVYYAKGDSYDVIYKAGSGTGSAPEDSNKYLYDANAEVLAPTDALVPPKGDMFDHWEDAEGVRYNPGEDLNIRGNATLTAVYSGNDARIVIKRKNLKENESAIYQIYKDAEETPMMTVILTGEKGASEVSKTISRLELGTYKVEEASWTWAYSPDKSPVVEPSEGSTSGPNWATGAVTESQTTTFTFSGASKETAPKHAEAIKVNEMKRSVVGDVSVEGYKKKGDIHVKF